MCIIVHDTARKQEQPIALFTLPRYSLRVVCSLNLARVNDLQAHKSTVWSARHLPQSRDLFATCGGNGGLNLYRCVAIVVIDPLHPSVNP